MIYFIIYFMIYLMKLVSVCKKHIVVFVLICSPYQPPTFVVVIYNNIVINKQYIIHLIYL